jgi:hypothetical protein
MNAMHDLARTYQAVPENLGLGDYEGQQTPPPYPAIHKDLGEFSLTSSVSPFVTTIFDISAALLETGPKVRHMAHGIPAGQQIYTDHIQTNQFKGSWSSKLIPAIRLLHSFFVFGQTTRSMNFLCSFLSEEDDRY